MPPKLSPTDTSQHKIDTWLQNETFDVTNDDPSQTSTPTRVVTTSQPPSSSQPPDRKRSHYMVSPSSSITNGSFCNCAAVSKIDEVVLKLDKVFETLTRLDNACASIVQRVDDIQQNLGNLTKKVDQIEIDTTANSVQLQANKEEIETLKESVNFAHKNIEDIKKAKPLPQNNNSDVFLLISQQKKQMQKEIDKAVAYSQRNNLIFDGIREEKGENCMYIVSDIIHTLLHLPDAHTVIDKVHRLGPRLTDKPRPIIVRFKHHNARDLTYERRQMLRGSGIGLREHLPPKLERDKSTLEKIATLARYQDPNARCISGPRLLFKGKTYDIDSVQRTGLNVEQIHQKETPKAVYFQGHLSAFSNFYQSPINMEGTSYHCIEQYYQAKKAERNGNRDIHSKIMTEPCPAEIKRLAKFITRSQTATAETEKNENLKVMRHALQTKFQNNPILKAKLLETRGKLLAEASAYDLFFGTGTALHSAKCTTETKFRGQNLLGMLLQEIRQSLK